jgi:hypothetical protein
LQSNIAYRLFIYVMQLTYELLSRYKRNVMLIRCLPRLLSTTMKEVIYGAKKFVKKQKSAKDMTTVLPVTLYKSTQCSYILMQLYAYNSY